jgi:hypothetical protein
MGAQADDMKGKVTNLVNEIHKLAASHPEGTDDTAKQYQQNWTKAWPSVSKGAGDVTETGYKVAHAGYDAVKGIVDLDKAMSAAFKPTDSGK